MSTLAVVIIVCGVVGWGLGCLELNFRGTVWWTRETRTGKYNICRVLVSTIPQMSLNDFQIIAYDKSKHHEFYIEVRRVLFLRSFINF